MWDPYAIINARDLIKLMSRSVQFCYRKHSDCYSQVNKIYRPCYHGFYMKRLFVAQVFYFIFSNKLVFEIQISSKIRISSFSANKYFKNLRSVPYEQAVKCFDDENAVEIIKIKGIVRNGDKFVKRRQRLVGPDGQTLKCLEFLTDCTICVQGQIVNNLMRN